MTGDDCTTPSSVTASWHWGALLVGHPLVVTIFSVRFVHWLCPLPVKLTSTIH